MTTSTQAEYLTPPEAARVLRVCHAKVMAFIRAGLLRAADLASPGSRRPRFRISRDDLEAFLAARSQRPMRRTPRRRRAMAGVTEYF